MSIKLPPKIDNLIKKTRSRAYLFLRWTEKWTKTDMIYLVKGGSWLTVGQIASAIISFGLSIAFANLMSKEDFGTYKYLLYSYGIIALFAMPGISVAITRAVSRGFDGSIKLGLQKKIIWSALASLISFLTGIYYFFNQNDILFYGFILIGIFIPLIEPASLYSSILEGKKLFKKEVIADILYNAASAIAIFITLYFWHNLLITIISYWSVLALTRIAFFYWFNHQNKKNDDTEAGLNAFSNKLTIYQIFNTASLYLDKIIVFNMLGPGPLAIFYFAQGIPERIKSLFRMLSPLSFAKYTTKTKDEVKKTITKKLLLLAVVIFIIIGAYIISAPIIFKYLFPQYQSAVLISQIIAISTFYVITYPINSLLTAHKQVFKSFVISSSGLISGTIVTILLIPLYGIWGAVMGLIVNRTVITLTSLYYLYRD